MIQLWAQYRRWLDLLVARCGLLGARVTAARQLLGPGCSKRSAAALPHLLNKGLLVFRSQVGQGRIGCKGVEIGGGGEGRD